MENLNERGLAELYPTAVHGGASLCSAVKARSRAEKS